MGRIDRLLLCALRQPDALGAGEHHRAAGRRLEGARVFEWHGGHHHVVESAVLRGPCAGQRRSVWRNVSPVQRHLRAVWDRIRLRGLGRCWRACDGLQAQHQAGVFGNADEPDHEGGRHRGRGQGRARPWRASGGRQHLPHHVLPEAVRIRGRRGHLQRHEVFVRAQRRAVGLFGAARPHAFGAPVQRNDERGQSARPLRQLADAAQPEDPGRASAPAGAQRPAHRRGAEGESARHRRVLRGRPGTSRL